MQIFLVTGGTIKERWAMVDVGGLFDQIGIKRPDAERSTH